MKFDKKNIFIIIAAVVCVILIVTVLFFALRGNKGDTDSLQSQNLSSALEVQKEQTDSSDISFQTDESDINSGVSDPYKNSPFKLLPFSIKNIYRIDDNDTFKYVVKLDYETGKKLIGHKDMAFLCDNDIPLLMSELSIDELEKLCASNSVIILEKCTDYSYGGLRENATYGIVYLYKEVN